MVNSILNAVTKQLGTTFGDPYHYYVENVEQDLIKPCFTVDTLIPIQRSKSPVLYDRTMPLVIHYFNSNDLTLKYDCYTIAEKIVECLEYLPFKNTILRGESISWQITENVLQVFITYKFTTRLEVEEGDTLEELSTNFSSMQ